MSGHLPSDNEYDTPRYRGTEKVNCFPCVSVPLCVVIIDLGEVWQYAAV
jgi:hypothetical protein